MSVYRCPCSCCTGRESSAEDRLDAAEVRILAEYLGRIGGLGPYGLTAPPNRV